MVRLECKPYQRLFLHPPCLDISGGQICVKPLAEDAQISQTVRATGCWELENVRSVLAALKKFPTATFLGIKEYDKITF